MTMVLPVSAFAVLWLFCSSRVFTCFKLYWCLVYSVLQVFVSAICLIFLVVRYLKVFCIRMSKCLIAFSVSIINVLINCFGLFSIAQLNPKFNVFILSLINCTCVKFTNHVWNVFTITDHPHLRNKIIGTQKTKNTHIQTQKNKWITFTYHSPLIHKVTNLFKSTNLNIAFRTCNTTYNELCDRSPQNKLNSSGIHRLQCKTCNKSYVGQTGRSI